MSKPDAATYLRRLSEMTGQFKEKTHYMLLCTKRSRWAIIIMWKRNGKDGS